MRRMREFEGSPGDLVRENDELGIIPFVNNDAHLVLRTVSAHWPSSVEPCGDRHNSSPLPKPARWPQLRSFDLSLLSLVMVSEYYPLENKKSRNARQFDCELV